MFAAVLAIVFAAQLLTAIAVLVYLRPILDIGTDTINGSGMTIT